MELKLNTEDYDEQEFDKLLIVPYGIETAQTGMGYWASPELLIVPYGIETRCLPGSAL